MEAGAKATDFLAMSTSTSAASRMHGNTGLPASEFNGTQTNPFEARGIGSPRLVWAPEVHERYQEKCSYFLVRLVNPNVIRRLDLAELLQQASIKSFCIYPIYGHFDFLIRMWVTPQKRDRFLRLINDQSQFDEVREFQAERISYLWTEGSTTVSNRGKDNGEEEDQKRRMRVEKSVADITKVHNDIWEDSLITGQFNAY